MKERIIELLSKHLGPEITREEWFELKRYIEDLEEDRDFLYALQAAGVDNWCGYGEACKIYNGEEDLW
jgi:hypothetical protein